MTPNALTPLLSGLTLPESARWRDGYLWLSDFFSHRVIKVDLDGNAETVALVPAQPSGLGWLPDGALLVVSMLDHKLLRLDADGLHTAADLSPLPLFHTNDMAVDSRGRAYIGNCGFDYRIGATPVPTALTLALPDGTVRAVGDGLMFPNGIVITPDERTLIVAETYAACLTAFDIEADGNLSNRRVWAPLDNVFPDGLCMDAEGAVWVASPMGQEVLRVHEGGEVSARIKLDQQPTSCVLGGADKRTLFILSTFLTLPPATLLETRCGRVDSVRVAVPGSENIKTV
jgi:sugar lactone lactonase YvrE